ncbi:MAG: endonuclease [Magnetococcales bacterium]|nr:endonuclease [Magnetococcales bacterium]
MNPSIVSHQQLYDLLFEAYGPQHWWPAKTAVAMMVGVILVQNSTWTQAAKVVDVLAEHNYLSWRRLRDVDEQTLWDLLRPAGYFRVKTKRLKAVASFVGQYDDDLGRLFALEPAMLRVKLLTVNGVGKESADSIICYGAKQPVFVVDAYTRRLFYRLGWVGERAGYDEIQELVHENMAMEQTLLGEYHALIVSHVKEQCKVRPICSGCPIIFCPRYHNSR